MSDGVFECPRCKKRTSIDLNDPGVYDYHFYPFRCSSCTKASGELVLLERIDLNEQSETVENRFYRNLRDSMRDE